VHDVYHKRRAGTVLGICRVTGSMGNKFHTWSSVSGDARRPRMHAEDADYQLLSMREMLEKAFRDLHAVIQAYLFLLAVGTKS
jgi:hypothetical protein